MYLSVTTKASTEQVMAMAVCLVALSVCSMVQRSSATASGDRRLSLIQVPEHVSLVCLQQRHDVQSTTALAHCHIRLLHKLREDLAQF